MMERMGDCQFFEIFPELELIESEVLREKVVKVWQTALDRSEWGKNIEAIPLFINIPKEKINLVSHTRAVTNYSLDLAELMNRHRGYNVNKDFLLAGALLHDVAKVVEYSVNGGKTAMGNSLTHGIYGVHLCIEAELPVEVIHIVASHTNKMGMPTKSIEAIIVHHCDAADAATIHLTME
jgi:putative nucleotidyltransferase with HDIG domain